MDAHHDSVDTEGTEANFFPRNIGSILQKHGFVFENSYLENELVSMQAT